VSDQEVGYPMQVRRQVWESLVSMLRVYAHAASLNGREYVVTGSAEGAEVKYQNSRLNLHFDSATGEAGWCITQPEREEWGVFCIEEDGTLKFPAGPKPLDTAAIDWIEQLVHCSSQALGIS
jgi:hypothetical protein